MADKHDIFIDQNADFRMILDYRNADNSAIDLTGYTYRFKIKTAPGGTTLLNGDAYVTKDNTTVGRANLVIPASVTATLNFERGVYDVLFVHSTKGTIRAVQGEAFLSRGVS
jgi:uncharacterized protein YegP (UPF0339 family)